MHAFFRLGALALSLLAGGCASAPAIAPATSVILVSVDGLRPVDVNAAQMPNLDALGNANVRADGMQPSYPALTFPNHYALVTGLRPDHSGIVHNMMADETLGHFRTNNRRGMDKPGWWNGVPVWASAVRAGQPAAVLYWPGNQVEVAGQRTWQWRAYQKNTRANDSIRQVLQWLDAAPALRPRFIAVYLDQVDEASHAHGPGSAQAASARHDVDAALGDLVAGLRQRGRLDAVNLVVVSDHGFDTVPPGQLLPTEAMAPADVATVVSDGQVVEFTPRPGKTAEAEQHLLGRHEHFTCWRKQALPARWHYGSNSRIPSIVCQMDAGWDALEPKKYALRQQGPATTRGSHGFDPALPSMRATFIAAGPAFVQGVRLPVFDNVDVYPLLMRLLQLPPEPNDGDIAPLLPALRVRP